MADASVIQLNEKLKGISSVFFNLGTGTIGAAVARDVLKGEPDLIGVGWFIGALVLIWMGTKVLTLLESEN